MKKNCTGTTLLLLALLVGCSDDPAPTDSSGVKPTPEATDVADAPDTGCRAVGINRDHLRPGCWVIEATASVGGALAEVEVPRGFAGNDSWVWTRPNSKRGWGAITLESTGPVYADPCADDRISTRVAPGVEGFTQALLDQRLTDASRPKPVSLGDSEGVYVELTVPKRFHRECRRGLLLWDLETEPTGMDPWHGRRLWIMDVAGNPVVLSAFTRVHVPQETVDVITGVAESARLNPA